MFGGETPLITTHTNVLKIDSVATNFFNTYNDPIVGPDMWIDFLIQPRQWDGENLPSETNDVLTTIYVCTNNETGGRGHLAAWIAYSATFNGANISNRWVEFPQNSFGPQAWLRVTVAVNFRALDFEGSPTALDYFQIMINNSEELTNYWGQSLPDKWDTGGSWFLCARPQGHEFHSISMSGSGMIDDLVVTNGIPSKKPQFTIRTLTDAIRLPTDYGVVFNPADGDITVKQGSNRAVSWAESEGHDVTNAGWGIGLGAGYVSSNFPAGATNYTFTNAVTNYTLQVLTKLEKRYLVITNPTPSGVHGTPNPSVGKYTNDYGARLTCTMGGSPYNPSGIWTQEVCVGYSLTVSTPEGDTNSYHGSITEATFNITGATTDDVTYLTWNWQTQYWLNVEVEGLGYVDTADQWCRDGMGMSLNAYSNGNSSFSTWVGNTNGIDPTNSQISSVKMDQARTLRAVFTGPDSNTLHGTSCKWIQQFYPNTLLDYDAVDEQDGDGDGMLTWQEYLAGTDPTDASSVFIVLSQDWGASSNCVTFYGADHTNFGVTLPFGMLRCTNLTTWGTSITNIPRSGAVNGTNKWWDPLPPTNVPVFYRPVASNNWTP